MTRPSRSRPSVRCRPTLEALDDRVVPATFVAQHLHGGAGDQFGTGVAVVDAGTGYAVYLSGTTGASPNSEGLVLRYNTPYALAGAGRAWDAAWPGQSGPDGFNSVAATAAGAYAGGFSYSQTVDTVGDKEQKGVVAGFTPGGSNTWVRQTPAAPGAFPYGGYESLNDVTAATEGGQTVLYATGLSQSGFTNGGRMWVSKVAAGGQVLWTRTDSAIVPNSDGYDVVAAGGFVYAAGLTNDDGTRRAYIKKYDPDGNLVWARTSAAGMFSGLVVDAAAGVLYAVGQTNGTNRDFLVEKWDTSGTVLWSRTYDRGGAADIAHGVVLSGGRLYAVGETRGGTAGGSDGILLQIDPATGVLAGQFLWGGAQDDSLHDVVATPGGLHVAGTTRSSGGGGADLAYLVFSVNRPPTDVTLSPATVRENLPAGTVVGTLAAADPDAGDTHTYALVGGAGGADNARFTVVGNELRTAEVFDYEAGSSYSVRVRATDAAGLWVERILTVTVADVNEAPSFRLWELPLVVPNNVGPQVVLNWAYDLANPEPGQALSFEVVSNSNPGLFAAGPTLSPDGTLTYTPAAGATGTATVGVRLWDDGGAASSVLTFVVEVVGPNLALNPDRTGTPSPLGSDRGWGGGSDPWELVDGRRSYGDWAHGLAFTGGDSDWAGEPAGPRQITVDLGGLQRFDQVVVWHHGDEHTPAAAGLEYWDGADWRPITFDRQLGASFEPGAGSGSATADRYTFAAVTGSMVRWSFDNREASVTGGQLVHGWVYEIEVIGAGGGEVLVNEATAGRQETPGVAVDAAGNAVVVWAGPDGDDRGVYFRRLDALGRPLGGEVRVNQTTAGRQGYPQVAADAAGNFVVTWDGNGPGDAWGVFARRYDASGRPLGDEFLVNTETDRIQAGPAYVGMNLRGEFVVSWSSQGQDGSEWGVYAQRFDAAGDRAGGEFRVNTTTAGYQDAPRVSINNRGEFVIAWLGRNADGDGLDVYAQRYAADGTPVGGEFRANTTTAGDQGYNGHAVGLDDAGRFAVAYTGPDGSDFGVYVQRYDTDGTRLGPEVRVNATTAGTQNYPALAMEPDGDFTVAWTSSDPGGAEADVYTQRFSADGDRVGDETRMNVTTAGRQYILGIALAPSGAGVVVWEGSGPGDDEGIFLRRFGD